MENIHKPKKNQLKNTERSSNPGTKVQISVQEYSVGPNLKNQFYTSYMNGPIEVLPLNPATV